MNEMDNQIMSISADSVIKVWDMRSSRCLQTITEKGLWEPSRCTIYYDNKQQVFLVYIHMKLILSCMLAPYLDLYFSMGVFLPITLCEISVVLMHSSAL